MAIDLLQLAQAQCRSISFSGNPARTRLTELGPCPPVLRAGVRALGADCPPTGIRLCWPPRHFSSIQVTVRPDVSGADR